MSKIWCDPVYRPPSHHAKAIKVRKSVAILGLDHQTIVPDGLHLRQIHF